jgi:hypothetical protein
MCTAAALPRICLVPPQLCPASFNFNLILLDKFAELWHTDHGGRNRRGANRSS